MSYSKKGAMDDCFHMFMDINFREFSKTEVYKKQQISERSLEKLILSLEDKEQALLKEALDELNMFHEEGANFLYKQGFHDCIYVLKQLKIIS